MQLKLTKKNSIGGKMKFKFIIDKNYLLLKMISNRNNSKELEQWKSNEVVNLLNVEILREIEQKKKL